VPLAVRIGAVAAGIAAFLFTRQSVFAGLITGVFAILAGIWATS
jgi:hypothetical protein